jgi:hypothetical protein
MTRGDMLRADGEGMRMSPDGGGAGMGLLMSAISEAVRGWNAGERQLLRFSTAERWNDL